MYKAVNCLTAASVSEPPCCHACSTGPSKFQLMQFIVRPSRQDCCHCTAALAVAQVYMLLLGVTAMSLLTTPFVILAAIHLLIKEGHHQLYISGPRLRLSSAAGDKPATSGETDWAIVMNDGQPVHAAGKAAIVRSYRPGDGARISASAGVRPGSAAHKEWDASSYGDGSGSSTHKRQQRPG